MIFIMLMIIKFVNVVPIQMLRNVQRIKFYYVNQELTYLKIKNVLMNVLIVIFQMEQYVENVNLVHVRSVVRMI